MRTYSGKNGMAAADVLMELFENGRARVSEWNQDSPLRRQVYRKMSDIGMFYGGKRLQIESTQQNGFVELRATLTVSELSDKLEGPDFKF